jgi:proteic killer suppression protein
MIRSYGDKATKKFAAGERVKAFEAFRRPAEKVLDRLDAALDLADVAAFPGHHLEKLKGNKVGSYSVRINSQWRVCFQWPEGSPGPEKVTIMDYH